MIYEIELDKVFSDTSNHINKTIYKALKEKNFKIVKSIVDKHKEEYPKLELIIEKIYKLEQEFMDFIIEVTKNDKLKEERSAEVEKFILHEEGIESYIQGLFIKKAQFINNANIHLTEITINFEKAKKELAKVNFDIETGKSKIKQLYGNKLKVSSEYKIIEGDLEANRNQQKLVNEEISIKEQALNKIITKETEIETHLKQKKQYEMIVSLDLKQTDKNIKKLESKAHTYVVSENNNTIK